MSPRATSSRALSAEDGNLKETLRNLWPYIWPHERPDLKKRVCMAIALMVLAKIITVLVPYTYKWATDALTGDLETGGLNLPAFVVVPVMLVIAYGVGRVLMIGFNELKNALFASVGQYAVRVLANETFRHVHQLSLRFHLARRTGGMSRIIERGTKGIEIIVRFVTLMTIPTLLEFVFVAIIVAYQFSWIYVLIIAAMVVLYIWFTKAASDWRIHIRRAMNDSDTDANTKAVDSLLNYETVKYFNNETMEAERFDTSMRRYEKAATQTWTSLAWLNMGQTVIFSVSMVLLMILSARGVMQGTQTVGDFVLINALLMQLWQPLNFIGTVYREIKQGLVDLEAMFDLLDKDPEVTDRPEARPLTVTGGTIRFDHVSFAYDPERQILHDLTFEVPAGKMVALVGPSGAGKSTISRLLYRFYDVTSGRILIDGQDIRDVTQSSLRRVIGMVPQDTVMFNDTIAYNIAYGRPSANREEIVRAADMAQITDFIASLPEGFDTQVGERGLKLSGGEKQRVAIARTILKAPPILILDEATSALDTATEQEIQDALDVVSQNRTTLIIAHRLSTVIKADEIIVLDKGHIRERGSHKALLAQNGLYASMWNRQKEAQEAEKTLAKAREEGL
jgi:ABC-type transport system involved in Fe-S cluster assembly fused permease/ATPase subunit